MPEGHQKIEPRGQINAANAPKIAGLSFRRFRGESDYPRMAVVLVSSENADKIERQVTPEDIAAAYQHLTNCDPCKDMIFAEIAGQVVGYARGWWRDETSAGRLYGISGFLVPAWRRKGIGSAMLRWMENRMRDIAAGHPSGQAKFFQVDVSQFQEGTARMLERAGYQPARYFYEMVRPTLDDIPDVPLPAGLELRPVSPDHYRAIWKSVDETSQDEWGYTQLMEDDYQQWLTHPHFQPPLWQIAWDTATGQVAGHVLTFIDHEENRQLNHKRGYTEGIGVDRAWRRRGLARALIVRSLQAQKAAGMSESALAADSDSLNGVTRLYESCGFQVVSRNTIYRKPL
jgi:mycothiol synthase